MQNARERLLEDLLAQQGEAEPPMPGWPMPQPGCPIITDLMDVALDQATAEVKERVQGHLPDCDYCRVCVEGLRNLMSDEEVPEPPLAGSLLERVAGSLGKSKPRTISPVPTPPAAKPLPIPSGSVASLGFTKMAKDRRSWPDLLAKLRLWLPYLMRKAGLPEGWADSLLTWVQDRLPTLGERRFTPALGEWFADFAQAQGMKEPLAWLPSAMTAADLNAWALEMKASEEGARDSQTMRRLKDAVKAALTESTPGCSPLSSSDELLTFVPPGCADDPDFEENRDCLFFAAQQVYGEATALFLDTAA